MTPLDRLRRDHPWPTRKPESTRPLEGWLDAGNKRALADVLGNETRVVVELGSWLGMSALFFAEHAPRATVICVDTWRGSPEHVDDAGLQSTLAQLYDSFLANTWHVRDRVIPLRALSWDGLQEISDAGVVPDLVYVDASHRTEDVERDLETTIRLFPDARLLGDDWSWASVRAGVLAVSRRHGRRIRITHNCYELRPASDGPSGALGSAALRAKILWRLVDQKVLWPVVRRLRGKGVAPNRPR